MSETPDNVIELHPDTTKLEAFPDHLEQILVENRDDMIDVLKGMIGRVEAFDLRGLLVVGLAKNASGDVTYVSDHCYVDSARTVGALEFMKVEVIDNRLRELEETGL